MPETNNNQRLKSALWLRVGHLVTSETLRLDLNATPQFIGALNELIWAQIGTLSLLLTQTRQQQQAHLQLRSFPIQSSSISPKPQISTQAKSYQSPSLHPLIKHRTSLPRPRILRLARKTFQNPPRRRNAHGAPKRRPRRDSKKCATFFRE